MNSTPQNDSILRQIDSYCASRASDILWRKKAKDILRVLLHDDVLTEVARHDASIARQLMRCRSHGEITIELYTALKTNKKIPAAFPADACRSFLYKEYSKLDEGSHEPWVTLLLLRNIGLTLSMPKETFPSEEELAEALDSEQKERLLMERLEPHIPFTLALEKLKEFDLYIKSYVNLYNKAREDFAGQTVDSLEHIADAGRYLLELRRIHRTFLSSMRKLRESLTRTTEIEELPLLSECLSSSGMGLALILHRHMDDVREELFQACRKRLSPKFDANTLRTLLNCIIPPLMLNDQMLAEGEIAALENGNLTIEESPLLSVIFPAIRRELEIDDDQIYESFPDFPYSGGLLTKLKKKIYSLKAAEETTAGTEAESELASEPVSDSERAPEHESITSLEPEDAPESTPESEDEPGQELAHSPEATVDDGLKPAADPEQEKASEAETDEEPESDVETLPLSSDDIDTQMFASDTANFVAPTIISVPPVRNVPKPAPQSSAITNSPLAATLSAPTQQEVVWPESEVILDSRSGDPLTEGIKGIIAGTPLTLPTLEDVDPADLVCQLIVKRDSCALYWLAKTLGETSPFPAWLAKFIHLGTHYQSRTVSLNPEIADLCDFASENMEDLGEKQKILLATAILRPALMMTEPPMIMLTIATSLSSSLSESYGLKSFMDGLCTVVRSGNPLEEVLLSESTHQIRAQQETLLKKETEELIAHATKGKTSYQPATQTKQHLFKKEGAIGKLLSACTTRDLNDIENALQLYQDERHIQNLVPAKIEAKARENIIKDIRIAIEIAKKWCSFYNSEDKGESSFAQNQLEKLNSIIVRQKAQLESCPEGQWFIQTMEDLYSRTSLDAISPARELELWPLRLPCSEPESENTFKFPSLSEALHVRYFDDDGAVASSLAVHTAFGRISQVRDFIELFPNIQDATLSCDLLKSQAPMLANAMPFSLDEVMDASRKLWQEAFERELDKLKEYLGECYFRGAIVFDQQSRLNGQISEIVARYSDTPDKALGIRELKSLYMELQDWDKSSLEAVNIRIGELQEKSSTSENATSEKALSFLKDLKEDVARNRIFSAAWDNIARLENYLFQPRELLPKLNAKRPSELAASDFYSKPENYWNSTADKELAQLWHKLCSFSPNSIKNNKSKFLGVTTDFQRRLGFVLSSGAQSEEVFTDGRPNHWIVIRYSMTINSPLPQWGSGARGQHIIAFGWNVTPTNISTLVTSGRIQAGEALTIVCCNALSHEARKEMLRLSHKNWPVFPLVIDENLFYFLASQDEATRTEKLFEVTLAGSPCNPYTPDVAGAVPREMFFGRENDKFSVFNREGSCIIYGGRQLGKSALLEQIYQEHNPEKNTEVKVIKYTMTVQDTSILDVVIRNCVNAGVVNGNTTRKTFNTNVKRWLDEKNGRRVLVLLDECDRALDKDALEKFPDVEVLRNLMQDTTRNFKVVFTGLHSVQRFSLEPNSPLYHFGPNLCIGPLSTDAAYDLMTRPMQFLGLKFETHQLVQMALNYCNYQPKLIQMFCSELVKGINRLPSREPVHVIDRSTMLMVYDSQDLKTRIRDCFTMTLALDTRYLVIGYVMALLQGEKISTSQLQRELRSYWPAAFAGSGGDITTLQSLLHEMEGLGLIISLGGSYRLRTPNIAELLGGQENVLLKLEQYYNQPYQPVDDPDELRMSEASVLVASQYNLLADKVNRLCWISGSNALGLEKIPAALKLIAGKAESAYWGKMKHAAISGMSVTDAMKSLRGYYDSIHEGGLIATISSSEFPHVPAFMEEAENWLGHLRTDKKYVKIVCIVDPECLYELMKWGLADNFSSYQMPLCLWTENSVDYWCKEKMLAGYDAGAMIRQTGGWHYLISPVLEFLQKMPDLGNLTPGDFVPTSPEVLYVVKTLLELEGEACPEEDLTSLIDLPRGMLLEDFQRCIDVLKSLHVLHETPQGLVLDSIAANAICGGVS